MDLGLSDKPVLVMASGAGIGRGTAMEFAREGAQVILFDRDEKALKEVQKEIETATGRKPLYSIGDMTAPEDIKDVVARTESIYGPIFALFNNTGGPPAGNFDTFGDEEWTNAFELTLLAYVRAVRAVLPGMRASGGGRIVMNTSSSIKATIDNLILSNAFRTGIMGFSKSLARELGRENILVNIVGPGKISTARIDYLDTVRARKAGITKEDLQKKLAQNIPAGRYGQVEEIARMIVFLGSAANTYVSGQSVLIDGAMISAY